MPPRLSPGDSLERPDARARDPRPVPDDCFQKGWRAEFQQHRSTELELETPDVIASFPSATAPQLEPMGLVILVEDLANLVVQPRGKLPALPDRPSSQFATLKVRGDSFCPRHPHLRRKQLEGAIRREIHAQIDPANRLAVLNGGKRPDDVANVFQSVQRPY